MVDDGEDACGAELAAVIAVQAQKGRSRGRLRTTASASDCQQRRRHHRALRRGEHGASAPVTEAEASGGQGQPPQARDRYFAK